MLERVDEDEISPKQQKEKEEEKKRMKKIFLQGKGKIVSIIAVSLALLSIIGLVSSAVVNRVGKANLEGSGGDSSVSELQRGQRAAGYALLYVQDGLTACYMGYTDEGVTEGTRFGSNGKSISYSWKNYVAGGKDACFMVGEKAVKAGQQAWRRMNGGIGYVLTPNNRENLSEVGLSIPYSLTLNDMMNFHVECVATFLGMTTDEDNPADTKPIYYTQEESPLGVVNHKKSPFRFGLLHSFSYMTRHFYNDYSYCNRWYLSNVNFYTHQHVNYEGCEILSYDSNQGFDYRLGEHMAYSKLYKDPLTLSVSRCQKENNPSRLEYSISYIYGGRYLLPEMLNTYSFTELRNLEAYASGSTSDPVERFSLFNEYGGVIYALRLYNRNLTKAEKNRNSFVDLCAYYSVNVGFLGNMNAEQLNTFLTECGEQASLQHVKIAVDKEAAAENCAKLYSIINTVIGDK